jgi:hypothetical protein
VSRPWLSVAVATGIVAIAVVPAVMTGLRDDARSDDGVETVASAPSSTALPGTAEVTAVMWGPGPGVCPDAETPCYAVGVRLDGYAPGRRLDVACEVADRPVPAGATVIVDDSGAARARAACAANRAAPSLAVTVAGETAATVDLPTRIVPSPTVTFTNAHHAPEAPGCHGPTCRFVDVTLRDFQPGAAVTMSCVGAATGPLAATVVTIGRDGVATDRACSFGHPGEQFWVQADDVRSATITWPDR